MAIHIHIHNHFPNESEVMKKLNFIIKNQKIMADELTTLQTLVSDLQVSIDTKQAAIASAIAAFEQTIADLTAQLGTGASPAQLQAIIDSITLAKTDLESTPTV